VAAAVVVLVLLVAHKVVAAVAQVQLSLL